MRKVSRRDFLKLSLVATASGLVPRKAFSQLCGDDGPPPANTDVVIIGAGVAGLKALNYIRAASLKTVNCVVLEGRDRIGGRIWTDHLWADVPIDLGASWLHDYVNSEGILDVDNLAQYGLQATHKTCVSLYKRRGGRLRPAASDRIDERFQRILGKVEDRRKTLPQDMSLEDGFNLVKRRRGYKLQHGIYDIIESENAVDIRDLSLFHYDCGDGHQIKAPITDTACPEGTDVDGEEEYPEKILTNGYETLINELTLEPEDVQGMIYTCQAVRKIDWNANGVTVTTDRGVIGAQYAIITLPLGVLQRSLIHKYPVEFAKPLPQAKLDAIAGLGMGVLNKVYLQFPNVFWDDTDFIDRIATTRSEWADWLNVTRVFRNSAYTAPPVLCALAGGSFGAVIDTWDDDAIVADAMTALRTMFRRVAVPDPVSNLVTHWGRDPFSYGSYSHVVPDPSKAGPPDCDAFEEALYAALAAPVDDRLFFAGEHTHFMFPQTVHGAYFSGKDAAAQVVAKF